MQVKDINSRLERIEPKPRSSDGASSVSNVTEHKVTNHNPKRSSPKAKNSSRETSLFGGWLVLVSWFCILRLSNKSCKCGKHSSKMQFQSRSR